MEAASDEVEDDGDAVENKLFKDEPFPCVCCKIWERDFVSGWAPSMPHKHSRKPTKARRTLLGNARKERNIPLAERRFVFRHYENSSQYIKQYRENHCSAFLETGDQWKPMLGVDVPDPYSPKTSSASQVLLDRLTLIDAISDCYKVTTSAARSDLKDICLTGKRTETTKHTSKPAGDLKQGSELPVIASSPNGTQDHQTGIHTKSSESTRFEDGAKLQYIKTALNSKQDCILPSVPSQPDPPFHTQGSCNSSDGKKECAPNNSSRVAKRRVRLPKFQWTECRLKGNSKTPSEKYTISMKAAEKGEKSMAESHQYIDNSESILLTNRQLNSRGNLHLGSTVKSPASKSRGANFSVVKNDMFSWDARRKFPSESTLIRVLGHQTGSLPNKGMSTASKERQTTRDTASSQNTNKNLSLHYWMRFKRRQFNHVLEARSFKPGEKQRGTTAVAEQN